MQNVIVSIYSPKTINADGAFSDVQVSSSIDTNAPPYILVNCVPR